MRKREKKKEKIKAKEVKKNFIIWTSIGVLILFIGFLALNQKTNITSKIVSIFKEKKEIDESCLNKIAAKECVEKGFTHKYVVDYDEENNNLVFRCLIKTEDESFDVEQFWVKLNEERLNICEDYGSSIINEQDIGEGVKIVTKSS